MNIYSIICESKSLFYGNFVELESLKVLRDVF